MSNFRERLRTLKSGLSDRQIFLRLRFIRCPLWGWLQAFFALLAVLASVVGYTEKTINDKRLAPESVIYLVRKTFPKGFFWAMFFCQDVTDHCTLAGSALWCRDHSTPPLLGSKHGMGSLGFRWSYADNNGVLATGANCTTVQLARLIAGVKKAGLDVHDVSLARG